MIAQLPTAPPVLKPPHDPLYLRLDGRVGWQAGPTNPSVEKPSVEASPIDGWLALSPPQKSLRPVADEYGTFGGLRLPTSVASDSAGNLYLLDRTMGKLKRFDPCTCRFEEVPCTGGLGTAPRRLRDPHGVALFGGDLFVCDTGNARVQVFGLYGMTLRAIWSSPESAAWKPFAIAFDSQGRAFVTDQANGVVHRFDRSGNWQMKFGALTNPTHLAIACDGRVYVVNSNPAPTVAVFDLDGKLLGAADRADRIAPGFASTGVTTDLAGNLHLGDRCSPPATGPSEGVFDLHGNKVSFTAKQLLALRFVAPPVGEAIYVSAPLDSALYRCQWHRVVLAGEIPSGTRVFVETFTTEIPLDSDDLANVSRVQWRTQQSARVMKNEEWDSLITSPPGRFLYLRLTFTGRGAASPRLSSIKLYFPRISLRRYLPAVFGENPVSADFTDRLLGIFDTIHRSVEHRVDNFASNLDPMSAPTTRAPGAQTDFLTWLASWMGLALEQGWNEKRRRRLLRDAHQLYRLRGTVEGLRRHLLLFLDWDNHHGCRPTRTGSSGCGCSSYSSSGSSTWQSPSLILEHFKLRRWLFLGEGRLGEQSVLWGSSIANRTQLDRNARVGGTQLIGTPDPLRDPFHVYAHKFTVFIPARCAADDARRALLQRLIAQSKPAHTKSQLELVHPRFRIGVQATIGLNTVVGRYPAQFTLGAQRLGFDAVLGGPPGQGLSQTIQVGTRSRIGATTLLH